LSAQDGQITSWRLKKVPTESNSSEYFVKSIVLLKSSRNWRSVTGKLLRKYINLLRLSINVQRSARGQRKSI
jgi:hypothetical protein